MSDDERTPTTTHPRLPLDTTHHRVLIIRRAVQPCPHPDRLCGPTHVSGVGNQAHPRNPLPRWGR